MKILAIVHFLDGQILEKEFQWGESTPQKLLPESPYRSLRIWLDHTAWFEMPNNTLLPSSQIAKVIWKELATPPESE